MQRVHFVRPPQIVGDTIVGPCPELCHMSRDSQERFVLFEFLRGGSPLADVFHDAGELRCRTALIAEQRQRQITPDGRPVFANVALLPRRRRQLALDHARGSLFFAKSVVGMRELHARHAGKFFERIPNDVAHTPIGSQKCAVECDETHADRSLIEERSEARLAIAKRAVRSGAHHDRVTVPQTITLFSAEARSGLRKSRYARRIVTMRIGGSNASPCDAAS